MGVYLPIKDYSAMQGPAPDGFHVPSKDEGVALCGILTTTFSMASKATTMGEYLKMPMAGGRNNSSSNVENVGSFGNYWYYTTAGNNVRYLNFSLSSLSPNSGKGRSYGYTVRCFKNTPVIPTSSWTTLYQGSGSAGIFYNATDGLISVSGDGTTWYTIQDKNLGATTVYNQGDTLTDANCGNFYQWGNNYGFPHSGTVTTSSTKVDASNYGPGNYYSSSTFITVSASPYEWSSIKNDNLWGATTGVKPMSELKNAYIGEYVGPDYLCFTANTAGSTVKLRKFGSPNAVSLETSTDLNTWSDYTIGNTITLSSIGDKVYWRNKSETDTGFNKDSNNLYRFEMTGSIAASGDVNCLLNKNSTTTLSNRCFTDLFYGCPLTTPPSLPATKLADYCYNQMFSGCTSLTTAPSLPATTLADYCYLSMFFGCTALTTLPSLPATALTTMCYYYMFFNCSNIKLSTSKTGSYQTAYRIPTTGTGTIGTNSLTYMFYGTGGTYTSDPSVNTTYYTSNTVV